jgi:hypothetical protein
VTETQSMPWVNFDITLHLLLGADEFGEGVMVVDQCCTSCCGRSLNMCLTVAVIEIAP